MYQLFTGALRVAREGARRAWNLRLAATGATVAMQLVGLFLISDAGWLESHALGLLIGGVLLVWLGNGLQPEPKGDNGPGDA